MSNFCVKGKFQVKHLDKDGNLKNEFDVPNGITDEGLNHILDVTFDGIVTAIANWYIGLIDNAGFTALAAGDTAAQIGGSNGWAENTDYGAATRVEWAPDAASARSIANSTTADFAINATVTLNGIFIASASAKSATSGTLWSTASFASTVAAVNGDTLKITYTVSG